MIELSVTISWFIFASYKFLRENIQTHFTYTKEWSSPAPKDKSATFLLHEMRDAMDGSKAARSVFTAVIESELTPIERKHTFHGAYL